MRIEKKYIYIYETKQKVWKETHIYMVKWFRRKLSDASLVKGNVFSINFAREMDIPPENELIFILHHEWNLRLIKIDDIYKQEPRIISNGSAYLSFRGSLFFLV